MSDRITMADVAREAGVSLMTVSRVVNDKGAVSPATRERVLAVVERLAYRPSGIARGLATKRTGTLGLVVPDVANPFFSDVARGVESVAYAEGYNVFLCNTDEDPQREMASLASLEEKHVDGLVLCSSRLEDGALRDVLTWYPSVVLVNRRLDGTKVQSVLVDDITGGELATRHLLRTGHQAIGLLAGPATSQSRSQRMEGYTAAFACAGFEPRPDWVRPCAPVVAGGVSAAKELLSDCPEVTALFCHNDLVAVGAVQACRELGKRVPGDVAIVGYDDIPLSALVTPALTTCRVPRSELGALAVRLLIDQIRGAHVGNHDEVVLKPELIVRESAPSSRKGAMP